MVKKINKKKINKARIRLNILTIPDLTSRVYPLIFDLFSCLFLYKGEILWIRK